MDEAIRNTMLALLRKRGPGKSICPSEVARRLRPGDWRPLMDPVRQVALQLREEGKIRITRRQTEVTGEELKGPVRLRLR